MSIEHTLPAQDELLPMTPERRIRELLKKQRGRDIPPGADQDRLNRQRALQMGVPEDLLNRKRWRPPEIEGVPPLPRQAPPQPKQEPQQIFPAPADFPPEPQPPLRSVLKRKE